MKYGAAYYIYLINVFQNKKTDRKYEVWELIN